MSSWRRALLLGLLVWLIPFAVSFVIFPLKGSWRSLFESIMPVVLSAVVVACALLYFRRVGAASVGEGVYLGVLWLAISVLIDLPLMLSPPIKMQPLEYAADIGFTYLMILIITAGIATASSRAATGTPDSEPQRIRQSA
jgi:hypothetical protein